MTTRHLRWQHEGSIMSKLSRRQAQILTLLVRGQSQKNAARQLGISYSTVRSHLRAARSKTSTQSSFELAWKARKEIDD
jgi:DNA-binding NarL/FixJ family response regulator